MKVSHAGKRSLTQRLFQNGTGDFWAGNIKMYFLRCYITAVCNIDEGKLLEEQCNLISDSLKTTTTLILQTAIH